MYHKIKLLLVLSFLAGCQAVPEPQTSFVGGESSLFVGTDGTTYLSWIEPVEEEHALKWSALPPASGTWSAPQTIVQGTDWFVNWADFPTLSVTADGQMMAHWLAKVGESTYAYGAYTRYSPDGGQTWQATTLLHEDTSNSEHGFVTMVPQPDGRIVSMWLDGRAYESDQKMYLMGRVVAPDGTLGPETIIDNDVCTCCQTSGIALADGRTLMMYRGRADGEIRDVWGVFYDGNTWGEPFVIHDDGWMIAGCPVNGPAVDAVDDTAVAAWFTGANDVGQVKVAFGTEDGFATPYEVDLGNPMGRVDVVALSADRAIVSWLEQGEEQAQILYRTVERDGTMGEPIALTETASARRSGFPRMVKAGDRLVFSWTDVQESASRVQTALRPLPAL